MQPLTVKSAKLVSTPEENDVVMASVMLPFDEMPGAVFGLIRILGKRNEHRERLAEIIVEHLERFRSTSNEQINIPRRFEQILQAINEDVHSYIKESPKMPLTDFHAIVGVRLKHQLFLSGTGKLSALFLHRTAKQRYVIYELDKQLGEEQSWEKPFVTVLDGELHPGDVFYIATRVSPREITVGELQDILVTLPPSGALKRIQQHLHRDTNYGAVALQVRQREESGAPKKVNPMSSIQSLRDTTDETANLLGEQSPEIGNAITRLLTPLMKKLSAPGTKGPKTIFKRILKTLLKLFAAATTFLGAFLKQAWQFTRKTAGNIKNRKQQATQNKSKKKKAEPKTKKTPLLQSIKDRASGIPKRSLIIAIIIAILAVVLVGVLVSSSVRRSNQEQQETIETILKRAEDKKNAAEASLIYDDVDQAETLVAEALALIDTLPQTSDETKQAAEELRNDLDIIVAEIQGVNLVEITALDNLAGQVQSDAVSISVLNGSILAVTATNNIYTFNELDQTWNTEDFTKGTIGEAMTVVPEGNDLLIIDQNNGLTRANFTNKTINPITSGTNSLASVEDVALYGGNVYTLSAGAEQITKMRPQLNNYDAGTPWINSANTDMSTAVSLAIDGDIYVLTNSTIAKFTSGLEQSFTLEQPDPALQNATQIWTNADSDNLYVLDPQEGRIVVFNKSGELSEQYFAEEFKGANGMLIREDQNSIYVLSGNQVYKFAAEHLLQ